MYNRLLILYINGQLTEKGLANAVTKKWITEEEREQILLSK